MIGKEGQVVSIGIELPLKGKEPSVKFLTKNIDIFAWSFMDMTGIDPQLAIHKLNVDPNIRPMHQKRRSYSQEKSRAIAEKLRSF